MADLTAFQKIIGIPFNTLSLLEQALTHSSYFNENTGVDLSHNERLEFLGDAILGMVVAEKLYQDFPDLSEGEMTKLRAALVCRETLVHIANSISLGDYLFLGKGEKGTGGRRKAANLAGAMEALIAAIYLDRGEATAREFILKLLDEELKKVPGQGVKTDYKSQLQELLHSRKQLTPAYRLVEAVGPDHDKRFTVEVMAGGKVMGIGSGKTKKSAETEAARSALEQLSASFTE